MNARLSAAALATAAVATLAACSASSKTVAAPVTPANTIAAAAAATSMSSAASTSAPATSKSIDICTAVPPATVVKLTGKPYTVATSGAANADADARCAYDDVDNTDGGVTLSVWFENAEATWQLAHTGNVTDVSGVGDKACWDNGNTLYAVSGSTIIQVNGLDAETPSVALAKALLDALH